jgi:hypothetical protein
MEERIPTERGSEVKTDGKNVQEIERRKAEVDMRQSTRPYIGK